MVAMVMGSTFATTYKIFILKPYPTFTDPAHASGRNAHHQGKSRNVFSYSSSCPNHAVSSKFYATNDSRVRANGRSLAHHRGFKLGLALYKTAGVDNIGKNHRGSAKYIVFYFYGFVYGYIILNFYARTNANASSHIHVLSKLTAFANIAVRHNVRKMPNFCARTNLSPRFHHGSGMHIIGSVGTAHQKSSMELRPPF